MKAALKEWAVAIDALTQGKTILLLRKGGIREDGGRFTVADQQVWLYPTYEHQQPELLKPPYAQQVQPVPSGWHPETVVLKAWAEMTHVFQISHEATVQALLPFHIWNEQFVSDRLRWKPNQPLYGLLLRVHALNVAQTIPYDSAYGGCKSWIELAVQSRSTAPALSDALTNAVLSNSDPVLSDDAYAECVSQIQSIVQAQ
jgi:hypothetical protein